MNMYVYKIIDIHKSKCEYEKKEKKRKYQFKKAAIITPPPAMI